MSDIQYLPQEVPAYRGNPFIEALPPIFSDDTFLKKISNRSIYDANQRTASQEIRLHLIADACNFFVPLPRHFAVERAISRMIRQGYIARNPRSLDYWKNIKARVSAMSADMKPRTQPALIAPRAPLGRSSALGTSLIGISGIGKTITVLEILSLYEQVLEHGHYRENPLNIRQVVWLRLETPHKGSAKDLCLSFFRELDRCLDTQYARHFGRGNEYEMLGHMANLASVHAVGLLVMDELQELSNLKSGGQDALLGFLLRLTNTVNVPVFMIGTYKARPILSSQLRHVRRSSGAGLPEWLPLEQDAEWDMFLGALWRFQYLRTTTELTPELAAVMYDESQGIPDFAVKLYFLAQDRLIAGNGERSAEKITPAVIRQVAQQNLKAAREILQALKSKDYTKLAKLDDVEVPRVQGPAENDTFPRRRGIVPASYVDVGGEESREVPRSQAVRGSRSFANIAQAVKAAPPTGAINDTLPNKAPEESDLRNGDAVSEHRKPGIEFWDKSAR